jgi:hypothetical protein
MSIDPAAPPVVPPLTTPFAPDWNSITTEVTCPLCDYNLRGLTQPLCPECGYRFEWPSVLDPKLRAHPYVFEHHPERNIRSFLHTLVRNFRPFRFWKELQPNQPSRVGRLMIYWSVCAFIALLPGVAMILWPYYNWPAPFVWVPRPPFLDYLVDYLRHETGRLLIAFWMIYALFPLLNFAALLVYRQSMRNARVKLSHVLRCAVYSGDVIVWSAMWQLGLLLTGSPRSDATFDVFTIGVLILLGVNAVRLISAYRWYMRFDHVVATIFAQQIILLLAMLIVIAYAGWMH